MQRFGEFFINHWDLFLALAVILAMLIGGPIMRRIRGYKEVEPLDAVQLINHQDALLVDVREDSEYRDGHVQDSLHVPLSRFASELGKLENHKEKTIIVGCRSGHRSAKACGILRQNGFESVYNLKGGVMAWQSAGMPLTRGSAKKSGKAKKRNKGNE